MYRVYMTIFDDDKLNICKKKVRANAHPPRGYEPMFNCRAYRKFCSQSICYIHEFNTEYEATTFINLMLSTHMAMFGAL